MTSTGSCSSISTIPSLDTYFFSNVPVLRDLCGLLTAQNLGEPDEREFMQLQDALRIVNSTEIGAELLRAIRACDMPADETPTFVFDYPNDDPPRIYVDDERASLIPERIIHFDMRRAIPGMTEGGGDEPHAHQGAAWQKQQAIDLFADLAAYYATCVGQYDTAPSLGFAEYSALTFREQLGDPVPQWQRDMEAFVRASTDPRDGRALAWELISMWSEAGDSTQPLRLISIGLDEMPPLRNLTSLEWLILADNRLTEFPSTDTLPPTLVRLDVSCNPMETPASSYGPQLRQVTADTAMCERLHLRDLLPENVELIEANGDYVANIHVATQFLTEFPETLANILPIEDMEFRGYTSKVMAPLYPNGMLDKAAAKWLAPPSDAGAAPAALPPASDSWQKAQDNDANTAAALSSLLNRLHEVWQKQPDADFHDRIAALLTKMRQPGKEKFLEECLIIARYGPGSCQDQMLYTLNSLQIASLNCDIEEGAYDDRLVELMYQGEDMLNMHTLAQYFAELRPELKSRAQQKNIEFDEVEQWLNLLTRLQGTTHIPAMQFPMKFQYLSVVEQADADVARERIAAARNSGFFDFLATWTPLHTVIRRVSPALIQRAAKWRERIYNDRGAVFGFLNRVMNAERVFAAPRGSDMEVFKVGPRMFWTRYEIEIENYLAQKQLRRDTPDVLVPACSAVTNEIETMIQRTTLRDFMAIHRLKLQQAIEQDRQPRWFTDLRRRVT